MTDIQVKRIGIEKLIPWEKNPRKHGSDINNIVKSIERFGWTNPILVQKGTMKVIAGHGRIEAAKARGLTEVPIIELDLNDKDASAYVVADNKLAELSYWDFTLLVDQLKGMDEELRSIVGFNDDEFKKIMEKDLDFLDAQSDQFADTMAPSDREIMILAKIEKTKFEEIKVELFDYFQKNSISWVVK